MLPRETTKAGPPQPGSVNKITADQGIRDPRQDATAGPGSGSSRVVRAVVSRLTTKLCDLDPAAVAVVKAEVPAKHRERLDYSVFVIFGSHVERAIAALNAAGYEVRRTEATIPDSPAVRTP